VIPSGHPTTPSTASDPLISWQTPRGHIPLSVTTGLVALIWALAAPMLGALFDQAIARVSGF